MKYNFAKEAFMAYSIFIDICLFIKSITLTMDLFTAGEIVNLTADFHSN